MASNRRTLRLRSRRVAEGYWDASRQPLHILVFLLPLVIAYEAGLLWLLRSDQGVLTIKVHRMLLQVFDAFGINIAGGLSLPGIALVVVLLLWHVLTRKPWNIDLRVIGLMALEAVVWTLPLLVIAQVIAQATPAAAVTGGPESMLGSLGVFQKIMVSLGAGLYEELVFRMLFIALLHAILVDIGKATHELGAGVAIVVSAVFFTYYHFAGGGIVDHPVQRAIFYAVAGLFFGTVYVMRGFGIVVAVHALYDIVTLLFLQGGGES